MAVALKILDIILSYISATTVVQEFFQSTTKLPESGLSIFKGMVHNQWLQLVSATGWAQSNQWAKLVSLTGERNKTAERNQWA